MSLENGECDCSCHEPGEGSMHVMACCSPCPTCGKNVLSYHDCTRSPANSGIDWDKLDELEGKAVKAAQGNPQAEEFAKRFTEQKKALGEGSDLQKRLLAAMETKEGRERISMAFANMVRYRTASFQQERAEAGRWGRGGEGPTLEAATDDLIQKSKLPPDALGFYDAVKEATRSVATELQGEVKVTFNGSCPWCGEPAHPVPCSEAPTKP